MPLYEAQYACVMGADHPTIGSRLTLAQFRCARHILVKPPGAAHHGEVIERALAARSVRARIAVEVSHFHGIHALVTSTDLIAIIPGRLAAALKQCGDVKVLQPPISLPAIRVSLYWHERFHRDPSNAWLRGIYQRLFKH